MDDVLARVEGHLGHITLNRPKAINALTLPMVEAIAAALTAWETVSEVRVVLLDGAGEHGFCAGGDIVMMRQSALDGDGAVEAFWRAEYQLNARIAEYPKPIVAFMDGVVMGGGVGLAGHAGHRVATERLVWAMPEVSIGFTPDVGGTWLLARAPGEIGTQLALTGAPVGAGDALACGFADAFVAAEQLAGLVDALREEEPGAAIAAAQRAGQPPKGTLMTERGRIDACYVGDRAEDIARRLAVDWPEAAAALAVGSPTSVKVTLSALRRAAALPSLRACLSAELRTSCGIVRMPDFVEGIRAIVVDKDRAPVWNPTRLEDVDDAKVAKILVGPTDLRDLWS